MNGKKLNEDVFSLRKEGKIVSKIIIFFFNTTRNTPTIFPFSCEATIHYSLFTIH
jgi:hypothetical protein